MDGLAADLPDDWSTLWYLVRRVATLMDRAGETLFGSELGISLPQYLVLSVVDAHPGQMNQQAVAERLGLSKGTISRQVESAVTAGLMSVEVSQHSRREKTVTLTDVGEKVVRRGDELFKQSRKAILAAIDPDDIAVVNRTLAILNQQLSPSNWSVDPEREPTGR
jgi:DNA-binding MarR family transcriptional regulator